LGGQAKSPSSADFSVYRSGLSHTFRVALKGEIMNISNVKIIDIDIASLNLKERLEELKKKRAAEQLEAKSPSSEKD